MLDFWFRPSPTGAFHARSYGQHYSQVDSEIIRPQSNLWEWEHFFQAVVSSEAIDLMVQGQDSKRPTSDWVSDKSSHLQRLSEIVFCFRSGSLHSPALHNNSGQQSLKRPLRPAIPAPRVSPSASLRTTVREMGNPLTRAHRVSKQKVFQNMEKKRSHLGYPFRTRLKRPHLSRIFPLRRKQALDRTHKLPQIHHSDSLRYPFNPLLTHLYPYSHIILNVRLSYLRHRISCQSLCH
jgi:hypothetical protein